jgi:hypothetical protein
MPAAAMFGPLHVFCWPRYAPVQIPAQRRCCPCMTGLGRRREGWVVGRCVHRPDNVLAE